MNKGFEGSENGDNFDPVIREILAFDINQFSELKNAHFLSRDMARYALNVIQEAFRQGFLNLQHFRNVVDFGAGTGAPTLVLQRICELAGGNLVALENNPNNLQSFRKLLPHTKLYEHGLEYLSANNSQTTLVTAFNLGPDENGVLFKRLVNSCSNALDPNGRLLVYSDPKTMAAVHKIVAEAEGVEVISDINSHDSYKHIRETVFLSKAACARLASKN